MSSQTAKPFRLRFREPVVDTPPAKASPSSDILVSLKHLDCEDDQMAAIKAIYAAGTSFKEVFALKDDTSIASVSQIKAETLMAQHGLGMNSVADLESRWSVKWSVSWGDGASKRTRTLYQCSCGYSSAKRKNRDNAKKASSAAKQQSQAQTVPRTLSTGTPSDQDATGIPLRHAPYDFTGCLAHVDITHCPTNQQVLRVLGILDHNDACKDAHMKRRPSIPLHPHVYDIALKQLESGADLFYVQSTNRRLITTRFYNDMGQDLISRNFRYLILPSDTSRLYRKVARTQGINVDKPPEVNVDDWLDPHSTSYQPALHQSVLRYSPRTSQEDRFQICIASKEMEAATWEFGHHSQIVLDGTFGVCDRRLLLFIVMGIDDEKHGVPLVFFLFSAPSGNQQTSAGYNTKILTELLMEWKLWMERNGSPFVPLVAITDTDYKERGALLAVFPSIVLLLCKFHLRQCWTNRRRSLLRSTQSPAFAKQQAKTLLRSLEQSLIKTTDHPAAIILIKDTRAQLQELAAYSETGPVANAGLQFISYLEGYWLEESLWQSWSNAGKIRAAAALSRPVEEVLPTTNHLESFNRVLKQRYIRRWQKGGKRLRFDVFIHLLILRIIPAIFEARQHRQAHKIWSSSRFHGQSFQPRSTQSKNPPVSDPAAWATVAQDATSSRQAEGVDISKLNRIFNIHYPDFQTAHASCLSSTILTATKEWAFYQLQLHSSGYGSCTCPDFQSNSFRAGACKHIFAMLATMERLRSLHPEVPVPSIQLPSSYLLGLQIRDAFTALTSTRQSQCCLPSPTAAVSQRMAIPPADPSDLLDAVASATKDFLCGMDRDEAGAGATEEGTDWGIQVEGGTSNQQGDKMDVGPDSDSDSGVSLDEETEKDALSLVNSSSRQGYTAQLKIQLNHSVRRILPQLHAIGLLLQEADIERTEDLVDLSNLIPKVDDLLRSRLLLSSPIAPLASASLPKAAASDPPSAAQSSTPAQDTPFLRAPSPEARQVRKNSYGIV